MLSDLKKLLRNTARFARDSLKTPFQLPRPAHLGPARGRALMSYIDLGFQTTKYDLTHSNLGESRVMASVLMELGYDVWVVNHDRQSVFDYAPYDLIIGFGEPFVRSYDSNFKGRRIVFATGPCPCFHNRAEAQALIRFRQRHGVQLAPRRKTAHCGELVIRLADAIIDIGNDWTASTFDHYNLPIELVPVTPAGEKNPPMPSRNYESARKSFVWMGGGGAVYKGLGLVLDAMALLDDSFTFHACGPFLNEHDFMQVYDAQLKKARNIHIHGFIDVNSDTAKKIFAESAWIVYPSSSEGTASAVIKSMQLGLAPLVTAETGVNIGDFGIPIKEHTPEAVAAVMRAASELSPDEVERRCRASAEYVKTYHTIEAFEQKFKQALQKFLAMKKTPMGLVPQ